MVLSERISLGPEELEQAVVIYGNQQTRVKRDIYNLTRNSKTLTPKEDTFVKNDGTSQLLILLDGTIPIQFDGNVYQIPVNLWIPLNYPFSPPLCYVIPSKDLVLKQEHQNVDADGKCFVSYTNQWKSDSCDLLGVSYSLSTVFSKDPPLYKKPQSSLPPLIHPPSSSFPHPHNSNHLNQPSPPRHPPSSNFVHPPTSLPPQIHYVIPMNNNHQIHPPTSNHLPHHSPHPPSHQSSHPQHNHLYNYSNIQVTPPSVAPPSNPVASYSNYPSYSPVPSYPIHSAPSNPQPPNNVYPNPYSYSNNNQTIPSLPPVLPPTSRYSHYDPSNSSNLPNVTYPNNGPTSPSTSSLRYPMLDPNYLNSTPQMPSAGTFNQMNTMQYQSNYMENGNEPQHQINPPVVQSTIPNGFFHQKAQDNPPVAVTVPTPIEKLPTSSKPQVQILNLLDGEDSLLMDNNPTISSTNFGKRKENESGSLFSLADSPNWNAQTMGDTTELKNRVNFKIRDELEFFSQTIGIQTNHAQTTHERLLQSEEHIQIGTEILKAEVNRMEELTSKIEEKDAQLGDWLEKHEGKIIEIDEAIAPSDLLSMQIFDLTAEESAIEDALYHLSQAFEEGKLDSDTFLKVGDLSFDYHPFHFHLF
eukprot:TRINITY_DN2040_c0_g1_i5.p1 TRINITY_DN2040_c0_g1~~TRINITY_DN2040_c0_g1_i5.p1  ORF type:complete len:638 (+),score=199.96 TRINITY_DN2040_c0_g1_i5:86-1999(+)